MSRTEPGRRPMMLTVVRPSRLDLDAFARAAGAHPEAVRGLVTLGAIDAERDASAPCGSPRHSSPRWRGSSGCVPGSP